MKPTHPASFFLNEARERAAEESLRRRLLTISIVLAATMLSGVALYAAFPSYDLPLLAWVAFVPLFFALTRARPVVAFVLSFFWGVVFYTGIFFWLFDLPEYNVLHHALLGVYLCPLTGLFGWLFCFLWSRVSPAAALLTAPFTWVAQEYLRSNFFFLALPWALLGHSQYQNPTVIQIAEFTGVYGVSFWIVCVNSTLAALLFVLTKYRINASVALRARRVWAFAAAVALVTAGLAAYGHSRLSHMPTGAPFRLALIQPSIEQEKKWDPQHSEQIMRILADLTAAAAEDRPDLIVWPETATPRSITADRKLYDQVRGIAAAADCFLLFGSAQLAKFKVGDSQSAKFMNSVYLMPPVGSHSTLQHYEKVRLMPFGEYLPHADHIPWRRLYVPEIQGYMPGNQFVLFRQGPAVFGVPICWENIFPDDAREFVQKGAQFLVNITNEAWFGDSAAPYQFLSMNVFRAVENRLYVVRCANTGISCFIDPQGRVVSRVRADDGSEIGARGFLTGEVRLGGETTFYTRNGDLFAKTCSGIAVLILLTAPAAGTIRRRLRQRPGNRLP
jgi:apolipoprotein N-acyltransferase